MTLPVLRGRLRRDLHDEDAANYRWTDAELDRHLDRGVRELSLSLPVENKATLQTTAGSRELSLASLTGLIWVEAVEYPQGKYPPLYARFSLWGNTLTLLVDTLPGAAENVALYYAKLHTLDATTSTLSAPYEDLVVQGAAGYAALEWASFATNRINVGGPDTWQQYLVWGEKQLAAFHAALARLGVKHRVRARRLYRPALPAASKTTDWGP